MKVRELIELLFGVVSSVGRGMGVLDWGTHSLRGREGFGVFWPLLVWMAYF